MKSRSEIGGDGAGDSIEILKEAFRGVELEGAVNQRAYRAAKTAQQRRSGDRGQRISIADHVAQRGADGRHDRRHLDGVDKLPVVVGVEIDDLSVVIFLRPLELEHLSGAVLVSGRI